MFMLGTQRERVARGFDPPLIGTDNIVIDYNTTLNDGYLGSLFEEERSEVR